jgi:hypothetical protein
LVQTKNEIAMVIPDLLPNSPWNIFIK